MFSLLKKKTVLNWAVFAFLVPIVIAGLLVVSCADTISKLTDNAQKPTITVQPANIFWNVFSDTDESSSVTLSVDATVTDGGTLSYQWYSNSTDGTPGSEEIDGGTNATLTLSREDYTENGDYYFYVIITNTNDKVTGTQTASTTSDVATFTVVGYPDTGYSDTHTLPAALISDWESEWGELFTISATEFSSGMDFGEGWSGYKGTIVNHRGNAAGTAGYITIQYTQNDWDEDAEDLYYVIYYKNLTDTTVTIAGAGSFAFTDPDFGASGGRLTKEEAEAVYTVSAGYFEMGSDLVKPGEGGSGFVFDAAKFQGIWLASNGGDWFVIGSDGSLANKFMDEMPPFYEGKIVDIVYFSSGTQGIMYVEMDLDSLAEWFASSGSGKFTALKLVINNQTSMGIFLIADTESGATTPFFPTLDAAKTAVNSSTIDNYIYGSVTDGLTYEKQQ
jgi:hypothetical protein